MLKNERSLFFLGLLYVFLALLYPRYLSKENVALHDNQPTLYKLRSNARLQGVGRWNVYTFWNVYGSKDEETSGRNRYTPF